MKTVPCLIPSRYGPFIVPQTLAKFGAAVVGRLIGLQRAAREIARPENMFSARDIARRTVFGVKRDGADGTRGERPPAYAI
jgi:hypothetical protein